MNRTIRDLKASAREAVAQADAPIWKHTLAFFLLTSGLMLVKNILLQDPLTTSNYYSDIVNMMNAGISPVNTPELNQLMQELQRGLPLFTFFSILFWLYEAVMQIGYLIYITRAATGREPRFSNFFEGFSNVGPIIGVNVLVVLWVVLWSVLSSLGSIVLAIPLILLGMGDSAFFIPFVVMPIVVAAACLPYSLVLYILADHPETGAIAAMRASRMLMRGQGLRLVGLILSFWPVILMLAAIATLSVIVSVNSAFPIGDIVTLLLLLPVMVWQMPYFTGAIAMFYLDRVEELPEAVRPSYLSGGWD